MSGFWTKVLAALGLGAAGSSSQGSPAYFWSSTGSSFAYVGAQGDGFEPAGALRVGDFDGDLLDDVVRIRREGGLFTKKTVMHVFESTGTGFDAGTDWLKTSALIPKNRGVLAGDVDGDGKDDLVWFLEGRVDVSLSSGSKFAAPETWRWSPLLNGYFAEFRLADVNADGRDDILRVRPNGTALLWLSTGADFSHQGQVATGLGGPAQAFLGQFGGTAGADFIQVAPDGKAYVWLWTGTSFSYSGQWGSGMGGASQVRLGDFTADGRTDVAQIASNGVAYVWRSTGSGFAYLGQWGTGMGGASQVLVGKFDTSAGADVIQAPGK